MKIKKKNKILFFLIANALFLIYSLVSVLGKYAAIEPRIDFRFILFYGLSLMLIGIYAVSWQQILKKLDLVLAFSNKSIVIGWGLIWGVLFFNEDVTFGKIFGIILVVFGVILFSISNSSERKSNVTIKKES